MEEELLFILKKVPKFHLKVLFLKWGYIPVHQINFDSVKYEIIQQIIDLIKVYKIGEDEISQLDLIYLAENSNKKLWKAHQLLDMNDNPVDESIFKPITFQQCLSQRLLLIHSCNVSVRKEKHALWGRINEPRSTKALYFIYFPSSPFVLINKAPIKLTSIFLSALKHVLGYRNTKEMELESFSPDSLAQILLHNLSPEDYTCDKGYYKPAKRHESDNVRDFCDSRVQIQHMKKLIITKGFVDREYGSKIQPKLPSLTITADTGFRGQMYLPDVPSSTVISCKTKIVGNNVLEGLRKAALLDLSRVPIPSFLSNVSNTGLQCIKLTDHKKKN